MSPYAPAIIFPNEASLPRRASRSEQGPPPPDREPRRHHHGRRGSLALRPQPSAFGRRPRRRQPAETPLRRPPPRRGGLPPAPEERPSAPVAITSRPPSVLRGLCGSATMPPSP